jgi:hypothetical protein
MPVSQREIRRCLLFLIPFSIAGMMMVVTLILIVASISAPVYLRSVMRGGIAEFAR